MTHPTDTASTPEKTGLHSLIRALRHRNFRLFFIGQSISLVGTWMQRIALGWLIYRLTNSEFLLGLVGFVGQAPTLLLGPFAGVLADRWNRHRLIVATQVVAMLQALVLALLVLTHTVTVWQIIVLGAVLGVVNAFDMPARQTFMIEMLDDKDDLGNAIALNSSIVNGARLLGPSIGGILIAAVGEGICFLLNGLSYIAVIAGLLMMRLAIKETAPHRSKVWQELKDGLAYAAGNVPIRSILSMLALISLVGMPYTVLMPVFAKDILMGGPRVLGFLMGAVGLGALGGALYLASRKTVLGLGRMIPIAAAIFGLSLAAFAFSHVLWISLPLMLFTGFGQMVQMASSNTLLQTIVDDDKRGRVMSLYVTAFMGMVPIGSLLAGLLASRIGAPWTVFAGGVACIIGAAFFARNLPELRKAIRPIYVSKGILPEEP
jgi:MFS family permease